MKHLNVEIKARCQDPARVRGYLLANGADFRGTDHQTDTYFHTRTGRLKLRQGNIENNLIYYERENQAGPKQSDFRLIAVPQPEALKEVLTLCNGIKKVVEKKREIYYLDNVKFHIDEVPGLGSFVEIEAGNILADLDAAQLRAQCEYYLQAFGITEDQLLEGSYSDMLPG